MRLPEQAIRGVLSPYDRASEVLFGLIMALTLTGALSVTEVTKHETRALFVSTLGCNVAWGLVDAVMYVLNGVLGRGRRFLLARSLRDGTDISAVLSEVLPAPVVEGLTASEIERAGLRRDHDGSNAVCRRCFGRRLCVLGFRSTKHNARDD